MQGNNPLIPAWHEYAATWQTMYMVALVESTAWARWIANAYGMRAVAMGALIREGVSMKYQRGADGIIRFRYSDILRRDIALAEKLLKKAEADGKRFRADAYRRMVVSLDARLAFAETEEMKRADGGYTMSHYKGIKIL